MGAKGAVSILYRGEKDVAKYEKEYLDLFGNPFPVAVRGLSLNLVENIYKSTIIFLICLKVSSMILSNPDQLVVVCVKI